MIAFLTSSPTIPLDPTQPYGPSRFSDQNGFALRLQAHWKPESKFLFVASDPAGHAGNDRYAAGTRSLFSQQGLTISELTLWDDRLPSLTREDVSGFDVIYLAGGHVPTENAFFQRIGLREKLQGFGGIVIGVSAGTMNSAELVYAQPELEGESIDPSFQRFLPGLGLTDIMVLPHYQATKDWWVDRKRLYEDITYPDSMGHTFFALVDGSYLLVEDGTTTLYGEAYRIADGKRQQLTKLNEQLAL
jgi:peptidase E